ncbi:hypothetical protein [Pararhizobium sp.]|uniref:hypothetical protein n=1 Tax=Pararhizobium sp. TaxID=1977563 RepID=UPI003D0A43E7
MFKISLARKKPSDPKPSQPSVKPVRFASEFLDWTKEDAAAVDAFLNSHAGRKLIDNLSYSILQRAVDVRPSSDFDDGVRAGMAYALEGIQNSRNFFSRPQPSEDEPLDQDSDDFEGWSTVM